MAAGAVVAAVAALALTAASSPAPARATAATAATGAGAVTDASTPVAAGAAAAPARPAVPAAAAAAPDAGITFPLHTSGASIVDAKGKAVRLNFVNWYGAESPDFVVGGLEYQPISSIISEIVSMGFNGIRLPWSNQMWETDPAVPASLVAANPQFAGEDSRTVFEQVVQDLANAGLMVILDNHNSDAEWCCSATDGNTLWYNSDYPQTAWVSDWKSVTAQFDSIPQVIGVDLRNEPRATATWGGSSATNWQAAAELGGDAVQSTDPNMLIFVEGVNYALDLSGVSSLPVTLTDASHLVYEAHDYGFDHTGVASYDAWVAQIQPDWGYLVGKDPLWIGEFGTCNTLGTCVSSGDSADLGLWFSAITRYMRYHNLNWSYWAINGTESDGLPGQGRTYGATETYGVLNPAWTGAALPALLAALQGIEGSCPAASLANGTYYIANAGSKDVIDVPGFNSANGTDLEQWPQNGGANQQWTVTSLGCGLYSIISPWDSSSIDVSSQSTSAGAAIDEWSYWGGGNQQFVLQENASGDYTVASVNSLDPVEVPGSSTTAGAPLDQGAPSGGGNQEWIFTKT
jgi:endoglucanase